MKRILIVGASGQDGTLLAQVLQSRGIPHLGLNRAGAFDASGHFARSGSLADAAFVRDLVASFSPTEIYYLAAHHHSSQAIGPAQDSELWRASIEVQVFGLVNILEAIRRHEPSAKLFYASSSHIFGTTGQAPQTETSTRLPDNIYAVTKVSGMEVCRYYRDKHGLFVSVGILYNHESAYRRQEFLSQKIIRGVLAIKQGRARQLVLGDLSSQVDWGYAPDYVEAMMRLLDLPLPDDYIVATGELHSVREFAEIAFREQGLDYAEWTREDATLVRPSRGRLVGDSGRLRHETDWAPSVTFSEMVARLMVETCRLHPELDE